MSSLLHAPVEKCALPPPPFPPLLSLFFSYYPCTKFALKHVSFVVFTITLRAQGVEWMKNPKNVTESAKMFVTPKLTPSKCLKRNCYYDATDDFDEHVMASCVQCPDQYPWYGNPYGEANL